MSASNARSVVRTSRAAPSGKLHPPRLSIIPAQRASRAGVSGRGRPAASSCIAVARAARPWTHGPHWPALWPLIHASRRAVSARPQESSGTTTIAPQPRPASRGRSEALVRTAAAASVAVDPAAVVAAEEDRRRRAGRPAGGAHSVDDARAERQLDHAGMADRAGDGGEERARLVDGPARAEPGRPPLGDLRDVRRGLDVDHQRRPSTDAALEHPRRFGGGLGLAAVEEVDERALLAGHEASGHGGDVDARGRFAGTVAGVERRVDGGHRRTVGAVEADDDAVGARRGGGGQRAVEDEVRDPGQQDAVLGAGRLALGAVDHHRGPAPAGGHGAHLDRRRERRAAAAAQAGRGDLVDEVVGRPVRDRPRRCDRATMLGQRDGAITESAQQPRRPDRAGRAECGRVPGRGRAHRVDAPSARTGRATRTITAAIAAAAHPTTAQRIQANPASEPISSPWSSAIGQQP